LKSRDDLAFKSSLRVPFETSRATSFSLSLSLFFTKKLIKNACDYARAISLSPNAFDPLVDVLSLIFSLSLSLFARIRVIARDEFFVKCPFVLQRKRFVKSIV